MSGNPFRRTGASKLPEDATVRDAPAPPPGKAKGKKKHVKIQTPPRSPEEPPRRLSAGNISPPPPPRSPDEDDDQSDSTATADSELEQATVNTRRNSGSLPPPSASGTSATGAPANPFARTLATNEASFGLQRAADEQKDSSRQDGENRQDGARKALDVDSFKNILMTGSATPSPPVSTPVQRVPDSSSSTDTSSVSRQSLYDPMLEVHQETPRTSFDQFDSPSEDEGEDYDEESSTLMTGPGRLDDLAPPAPPKPGQAHAFAPRGPQTVSFADFDETIPAGFTSSRQGTPPIQHHLTPSLKPPTLKRSPSDLNKPLPPPPEDLSSATKQVSELPSQNVSQPPLPQESDVVSPTTQEAAQPKKAPPPPPASRRAGQTTTPSGRSRSGSNLTQNSTQDDESASRPTEATSKTAVPPPPPSRKTKPASDQSIPAIETPPQTSSPAPNAAETKSMPPPPPRRNTSKVGNALHRTSSNASRTSVSRNEPLARQNESAPPAPPPRRAKRDSMDGHRRSSDIKAEDGQLGSLPKSADAEAVVSPSADPAATRDILADMSAFQAEIDALRAKSQRG